MGSVVWCIKNVRRYPISIDGCCVEDYIAKEFDLELSTELLYFVPKKDNPIFDLWGNLLKQGKKRSEVLLSLPQNRIGQEREDF